jgi:hypothetical protein
MYFSSLSHIYTLIIKFPFKLCHPLRISIAKFPSSHSSVFTLAYSASQLPNSQSMKFTTHIQLFPRPRTCEALCPLRLYLCMIYSLASGVNLYSPLYLFLIVVTTILYIYYACSLRIKLSNIQCSKEFQI